MTMVAHEVALYVDDMPTVYMWAHTMKPTKLIATMA